MFNNHVPVFLHRGKLVDTDFDIASLFDIDFSNVQLLLNEYTVCPPDLRTLI